MNKLHVMGLLPKGSRKSPFQNIFKLKIDFWKFCDYNRLTLEQIASFKNHISNIQKIINCPNGNNFEIKLRK